MTPVWTIKVEKIERRPRDLESGSKSPSRKSMNGEPKNGTHLDTDTNACAKQQEEWRNCIALHGDGEECLDLAKLFKDCIRREMKYAYQIRSDGASRK